ncbi:serine hydrolase domain-containing protein [Hyphomonas pacifica]|uniref:Beta-lactamase-related domain-containing protein n=1 Tax=Hyphomonas pacifica TaxID=1280941 RepID=A0A062TWQ5_9PROT|nr:serine hydrolase [Hyphomonas pacifica]KCZ50457.1 hypothetical protein HY2_13670 [Hyphomonas pacifica]RAN33893.1 hypothetical protein HY3_12040 [Hyphomonas pacifica]RAN35388.1 hypothetical protein HY11_13880 [Hyphomonas pacifica]
MVVTQAGAQEAKTEAASAESEIAKGAAIATGVGAKVLCSGIFISHRSEEDVVTNDIAPLWPPTSVISYEVDEANHSVKAQVGPFHRVASYDPVSGCTLDTDPSDLESVPDHVSQAPEIVSADTALQAAFDAAMVDPEGDLRTRALVVIRDGQIVGEQYADGFDASMPLLGWSMSKSVTAALAGLVVKDGLLELDAPLPVPEWKGDDPRAEITLRNLLQMSSGLSFVEEYTQDNDSVRMLFLEPDMAAYAANKPLEAEPGTVWSYSSGTTNIVARALTDALGGSKATQAYLRERLFAPAGMKSVTFEQDTAGTPVGSSYVYATGRDWAQFGLLFLNQGKIDGQQILSSDWVDFVRTPAPANAQGIYGGSFWLNGEAEEGDGRYLPDLPEDAYFAMGHNGQIVGIFPSQNVVIVRLGWTTGEKKFDANTHFSAILNALVEAQAAKQ